MGFFFLQKICHMRFCQEEGNIFNQNSIIWFISFDNNDKNDRIKTYKGDVMFVIIAGPSGVGKNTVIEELLKRNSNLRYLMSCSTRKPREHEVGKGYIYLNFDEMQKKLDNNELFEHEEIHGNIYGTLNSSVQDIIEDKHDYIKDLGVLGQKYYVSRLKDKVKIVSIYLTCPKDEVEKRLINRGEQEVSKRLERFDFEESHKGNFDYVIENVDLNETVEFIENKIYPQE